MLSLSSRSIPVVAPLGVRWLYSFVVGALVVLAVTGPTHAQTVPESIYGGWVSLGPRGPHMVAPVAVSSGWPEDPFIYIGVRPAVPANRYGITMLPPPSSAARTHDGGDTWEYLLAPPEAQLIQVLFTRDYGRVLLGVRAWTQGNPNAQLLRSTDDGSTWQAVDSVGAREVRLVVSPDVFHDGRVFALVDGELWETVDAGASWWRWSIASHLRVVDFAFSPTFVRDSTMALTVAPRLRGPLPAADYLHWARDHEAEWLLLMSADGGVSFVDRTAGLEIQGTPARSVNSFAFSPAHADDRTLFVHSHGVFDQVDPQTGVSRRFPYGGIFKSQDAGESWVLAHTPTSLTVAARAGRFSQGPPQPERYSLLVDPKFNGSGVVLATLGYRGRSAVDYGCGVLRSPDGGSLWTRQLIRDKHCTSFQYAGGSKSRLLATFQGSTTGISWRISRNAGIDWDVLGPGFQPVQTVERWRGGYGSESQVAIARDGTIVTGEAFGVWAQGDSARETLGRWATGPTNGDEE